ncbi:SGNH/GDSL hydrolase family protein [Patescibacteria group bacterium]|nr:SGNH/GDSL hydrolase family protein [Patescibacteria group bacterium]
MKKNIILLLSTIVITVIAVEFILHIAFPIKYPLTQPWVRLWNYHSILGWVTQKNIQMGPYKVTNSKGLRGKEYSYNRANNKKRVLIFGDSFAHGYGFADTDNLYHEIIMSKYLPDTELINMGVSGYGTDQSFLSYKTEGYKYNPDIVILIFYANDFAEDLISYDNGLISPNFIVSKNNTLKLKNVPVPLCNGWGEGWIIPSTFREYLFVYSRLYNLYNRILIGNLERLPYDYDVYPTQDFLKKSKVTMRILEEFNVLCKKNNSKFIIVTIPYMSMIEDDEWNIIKNELQLSEEDRFGPYEDFFNPLKESGIPVIHFNKHFHELRKQGTVTYDSDSRHWNFAGHQEIAALLADIIKNNTIK